MKATVIKHILLPLLVALSIPQVHGQVYYSSIEQYQKSHGNRCMVDWMGSGTNENRYTIAIRPFYLANNGIKVDFEMELPRKGSWLQFEGIIRFNTYDNRYRYFGYWESGDNWFTKLNGYGIGAYYKNYFRPKGWYYDIGILLNHYGVDKPGIVKSSFIEDGLTFIRYDRQMIHWNFFKPSLNFNIGKHFALTRTLFLDAFAGVGYTYSFHDAEANKYFDSYDPRGFSYRGLYVSGGFRIGILWSRYK